MNYQCSDDLSHTIDLSIHELSIICKTIAHVLHSISSRAFPFRMFYTTEETQSLLSHLENSFEDSEEKQTSTIEVTKDDFYVIWQAFNEVCHGLKVDDYEKSVGTSKENLLEMFEQWRSFEDRINPHL